MKKALTAVVIAMLAGCGPKDPNQVLGDGDVEIPSKQFFYKKFDLPIGGTYSLTITPQGGDLEGWVDGNQTAPILLYNDKEPLPKATPFPANSPKEITGTLGWGQAAMFIFNRNAGPIKARVRLTVKPNPPTVK